MAHLSANACTTSPGRWDSGILPPNTRVGENTLITIEHAFRRFRSELAIGLRVGAHSTMDGVHFAVGSEGAIEIGDYCYFTNAVLLCEASLSLGRYVVIGWNATIADSDFHPIGPAERIADAIACSPLAHARARPPIVKRAVVIEDDVWIGPNATLLKGVRVGAGAVIEPGALVTHDVLPNSRVGGNPARLIEGP